MNERNLHIVMHDVPWPVDHGGMVDLFYKLKALHANGVNIQLHCFTHKRPPRQELNKFCVSVKYYVRKTNLAGISLNLPYIVSSRRNKDLVDELLKDDHPVLFEGIHTTWPIYEGRLKKRKLLVRIHNTEYLYYQNLARLEQSFFRKLYYSIESRRLKKYEAEIAKSAPCIAVSSYDAERYKNQFQAVSVNFLPIFTPYFLANGDAGKGTYCLYQGNLGISENDEVAKWLLNDVFAGTDFRLVISGRNPSPSLKKIVHHNQNACLLENPSDPEMQDLIRKAHINILPSFNNTGIKLKLLNAIFNGRHCLVNWEAVDGSGLETLCHVATGSDGFRDAVKGLMDQTYDPEENEKRQGILNTIYNNELNAEKLIRMIWP